MVVSWRVNVLKMSTRLAGTVTYYTGVMREHCSWSMTGECRKGLYYYTKT